MNSFWSAWIIILTVTTIVGITWILFATRTIKNDRDDNTTGHVYDGIVEEDNPLPSWWFSMFVLSILFAVGYLIIYPGLGNFAGVINWTSSNELDKKVAESKALFAKSTSGYSSLSIAELSHNPQALKMGQRLFANNCAVCHGGKAQGSYGFPNLTDKEWQWGNSQAEILATIQNGRQAAMPAWQSIIPNDQIDPLAEYVASLSSTENSHPNTQGKTTFNTYCVACHGVSGGGNSAMGAPALNDATWLYGGDYSDIKSSILFGRNGEMPAHQELLGDTKVRLLTAYVIRLAELNNDEKPTLTDE